jgi:hypothetical protein
VSAKLPNTPFRANRFRFIRVVCQLARPAMARQLFGVSGRDVSISNGTSGGIAERPALKSSNARARGGSAVMSYGLPSRYP